MTSRVLTSITALFLLTSCSADDASLIERATLERACVVSAGCGVQERPSVQGCVDFYFDVQVAAGLGRTFGAIYRCALDAAGNCDKVRACFGPGEICDKNFLGRCEGSRAIACDLIDDRVYVQDCGKSGLRCALGNASFAAECRCDEGFSRCEGGWAIYCRGGQIQSEHCVAQGKVCEAGVCSTPGGTNTCDKDGARCEDSTAITCRDQIERRVDCATLPIPHACQNGHCVPLGGECDDDFNRCASDGELEACIAGSWQRFDCVGYGFDQCLDKTHGANCYVSEI